MTKRTKSANLPYMRRKRCEGSGKPATEGEIVIYPYCSVCGKEFSAQGANHRYNRPGTNNWESVPVHFVKATV